MRIKQLLGSMIILVSLISSSGCLGISSELATPSLAVSDISTQAAQTVVAAFTETAHAGAPQSTLVAATEAARIDLAVQTIQAELTSAAASAIPTVILATPTIPVPTATPLPPVLTATPIPYNCDQADFLGDFSPSSNAILYPGQVFRVIWRFQNVGSCTWTPDYRLVMVNGDFQGAVSIPIPTYVRPGQTIDLTFALVAPAQPGYYNSFWNFKNANGQFFGIGPDGATPVTIQATVIQTGSRVNYDFATNYCAAEWRSRRGIVPCQGNEDEIKGMVAYLDYINLENGYNSGPAMWTHPDDSNNGWISGSYPAILIQPGDHLRTKIGCLEDSFNCDILMQIEYELANNIVLTLGQWHETYDGRVTTLDLDLSTLAGQYVKFIFTVTIQNNQREDADGVWVFPRTGP
ncbi:MAG: hypothetical protein H6Q37_1699 [Chloroflexi bacterium]|nr:hypothetical protein [Chloroflexota bacterium]